MKIVCIILIIVSLCLIFYALFNIIKTRRNKKNQRIKINELTQQQDALKENILQKEETLKKQNIAYDNMQILFEKQKHILDKQTKELQQLEKNISILKKTSDKSAQSFQNFSNTLELHYQQVEKEYDQKIAVLQNDYQSTKQEVIDLKNSLSAGRQAQIREEQKENKINFYKIDITKEELSDIVKLQQCKKTLSQPIILNKVIWSQFFQKKSKILCDRILGTTDAVCGIYKITNIQNKLCYIGQSVNVANRLKQHMKCGCGIDAPASNRLYKDMQEFGLWNFTFELLEQCNNKIELDKKEKFFIDLYQANAFGNYNMTKGNG
ncbi:MAG: GIY-YIG nuclease family protein [Mollicutes bacterium]|nr:GIY-YIG nuclease family protein [Mollicutes bacterium]